VHELVTINTDRINAQFNYEMVSTVSEEFFILLCCASVPDTDTVIERPGDHLVAITGEM